MDAQLTELLTNYGPIGGIWFDGMWDKPDADWRLDRHLRADPPAAARRAHRPEPPPGAAARRGRADVRAGPARREHGRLQHERDRRAAARDVAHDERVVGIQHHRQEVQVGARADRLPRARRGQRRATCCSTSGRGPTARFSPKPSSGCARSASGCARTARRSTARAAARSRRAPWGATTRRGDTVFVHVLDWPDRSLSLPPLGARVVRASMLGTANASTSRSRATGVTLTLPNASPTSRIASSSS